MENFDFYTDLANRAGITREQARKIAKYLFYESAAKAGLVRKTPFELVAEFHEKFGLAYQGKPRDLDEDLQQFRIGFMLEELQEYAEASGFHHLSSELSEIIQRCRSNEYTKGQVNDPEKQMDALIDLDYVLCGTAYLHGFQHDEGYRRVHAANMNKVRVKASTLEGSVRKSKYDVVKPEGWQAPSLKDLLEE